MTPLSTFPLPLPPNGPPTGYGWEGSDLSIESTTSAFNTEIDRRDSFLGWPRCVICGINGALRHCHIIRQSEPQLWSNLKQRSWIPAQAKESVSHEPRNGLLMCANHHIFFDEYDFFIRFIPNTRKFIFVNFSNRKYLEQFHGKAIALDIRDRHVPFPSIFIIHEMRVRGFHPFEPVGSAIPDEISWQDWMLSDNIFDNESGFFKRDAPPDNGNNHLSAQPEQTMTTSAVSAPSGRRTLELNADVIAEILAATHALPSWKACQIEGTIWTGTADENIQKYISSIGTQDNQP